MKNKQVITLLILSILSLAIAGTAYAQTVTVGVSKGDIFTYDYALMWNSTDPTQTIPSEFMEIGKIQSIQITVTDIAGSTINTETKTHYQNETEKTQTGYVDVSSGAVHMPFGFLIVRAGMSATEKIYPFGGEATINDTTQRTYSTGQRETNHHIVEITSSNYFEKTELNFDKKIGIAVDYVYESRDTSGGYITTLKETLTNTNSGAWSVIPEFPSIAVLMLLLIAIPIVLVAYKKKWGINHKFAMPLKR